MSKKLLGLAALALLTAPLSAQERSVSLGFDLGLEARRSGDEPSLRRFQVPSAIRLGIEMSERLVVETRVSYERISVEESVGSVLELRPGVSWMFGEGESWRPYARAALALARTSGFEDGAIQLGGELAVGLLRRLDERASLRVEAGWTHLPARTSIPRRRVLFLTLGLSVGL